MTRTTHLHPIPQSQKSSKSRVNFNTRHLLLLPRARPTRLGAHSSPSQEDRLLLPRLTIAPRSRLEAQLDHNVLHNGIGVQQHVDERGWEVE